MTPEGNLVLRFVERVDDRDVDLSPSSVPWGIAKMLTVLTAIYILRPSLLVVDEVENSLHLSLIERLLDELERSDVQAILTTHSTMVIDLVDPGDVILLDKAKGETAARRFDNPERLRRELSERGLTLSEHIFYSPR